VTHDPVRGGTLNVVDEDIFRLLLYLEGQKAARLQYCVSLLCVSILGGPEDDGRPLAEHVAQILVRRLRGTDVVTLLSGSSIGILLVDAETPSLRQIFERATASVQGRQITIAERTWRVALSAGGGCYPRTAATADDLLRQASALMTRAIEEGKDRLYLPG
jgi:Diguanylate cyclase, GGDEF domain